MANHRMFSNRIANSAKFLQMPAESQLLYFHMVLRADDDGIVEAYPLMKLLGVAPDNFKVLIAKAFIKQLNEDQVIVITEWLEHNKIRADRKVNSIYLPLLLRVIPELPTIIPKPRSDVEDNSKRLGGQSTDGLSKVKLSKVKLISERSSREEQSKSKYNPLGSEIIKSFETINPACRKMYGNTTQREACDNLIKEYAFERVKTVIEKTLPKTNTMDFFPNITTPDQLWKKWAALEAAVLRHKGKEIKNNNVAFS